MYRKYFSVSLILLHLLIQIGFTIISSLHWILLVVSLITYFILLYKEYYDKLKPSLFVNHFFSSIIFIFLHFIFLLTYNKILPWEIGLTVLFLILIGHYSRRLGASIFKSDLAWLPFGYQHEPSNSSPIVTIKFLISGVLLFGYTCQLTLTTVCTPSIYFDWFLIIDDCRYTYANMFSSYTFAGGILILLSWTVVCVLHLLPDRYKV